MPKIIETPARIEAHGQPPKVIEEFVGKINSATESVSVARMISPSGWSEPGQRPEFDEVTVVLRGELQVESEAGVHHVSAGQAIIVERGQWFVIARPHRRVLNTSRSACQRFLLRSCTAIWSEAQTNPGAL